MNSTLALPENDEEEPMSARTRRMLRWAGLGILALIVVIIMLLFAKPAILSGALGVIVPIGLFTCLLAGFYLLILSTKV